MTPEEILLKAADYMAEHGKTEGWYRNPQTGAVCALGAIYSVVPGTRWVWNDDDDTCLLATPDGNTQAQSFAAIMLLQDWLYSTGQMSQHVVIPLWNDNPETTAEDVILAMKKAASHDA